MTADEITKKIRHIVPPDRDLIRTARARLSQAISALSIAGKTVEYATKLAQESLDMLGVDE